MTNISYWMFVWLCIVSLSLQCRIVSPITLIVELLNPFIKRWDYLHPSVNHLRKSFFSNFFEIYFHFTLSKWSLIFFIVGNVSYYFRNLGKSLCYKFLSISHKCPIATNLHLAHIYTMTAGHTHTFTLTHTLTHWHIDTLTHRHPFTLTHWHTDR